MYLVASLLVLINPLPLIPNISKPHKLPLSNVKFVFGSIFNVIYLSLIFKLTVAIYVVVL